jgi:carbonic anhydrase
MQVYLINTRSLNQSPININLPYEAENTKLKLNLTPVKKFQIKNDGYKISLLAESFGSILHGDHAYVAKEIHIHHPSEHTVYIINSVWKR